MATIYKRAGARGTRYTARVRLNGVEKTKTFATKTAATGWARAQEGAIATGTFRATDPQAGKLFADAVDLFLNHRRTVRRMPGKTFANVLTRLKAEHGLEPISGLNADYWRRAALKRMSGERPVASQTAAGDLLYVASVLRHAKRERWPVDDGAPAVARAQLAEEKLRITSRHRDRRISDGELERLLAACDAVRSSIPVGDIVRFALVTAMRRGEILRLRWDDLNGRIIRVHGRKHPHDRERVDEVPLLKVNEKWPRWDALEIAQRQPKRGPLIFPYADDSLGERFEKACKVAKVEGVVFHLLRHESLSRYAERGFDALRLQVIGGHRDLRHLQRYARIDATRLANE